jgi:hypothetical protein
MSKRISNKIKIDPMDEAEQNKIIEEIRSQANKQNKQNRFIFYVLFLAVGFIYFICLLYAILIPWEMEHQKHFKNIVHIYWFIAFYICSFLCSVSAAFISKVNV